MNTFKSYADFENFKGVIKKLGRPCPFVFWTKNGHISLNFAATKKFKKSFLIKKAFQLRCIFYIFALASTVFDLSSKTRYSSCSLCPMMLNLRAIGHKLLGKYRVFDNNSKTVQLRVKLSKYTHNEIIFLWRKIF